MNLEEILDRPCALTSTVEEARPMVISSRVRLARNLADHAFPGWAGEEECERLWRGLEPVLRTLPPLGGPWTASNEAIAELDRRCLFERHLISVEHARRMRGSGLVLRNDETVAIMVNEEDHLRMQALSPGLCLPEVWARIEAVDRELEKHVTYAFSPRLGYLTACPTNVGTGMRASVMLHLPGLMLMQEVGPVIKGIQKIGLTVRGLWGEGTEFAGNMFQVSNQITLGVTEEETLERLHQVVLEVVEHEANARARLRARREAVLLDHIGRARGILTGAHVLASKEALDLLSALRLGMDLGILNPEGRSVVDELFRWVQPAHVQRREGRPLSPAERDQARARRVREEFKPALLKAPRRRRKKESDEQLDA